MVISLCDSKLTLICQVQSGRVLSSVVLQNDLIHARILLGNLSERAGTAGSGPKQRRTRIRICMHLNRQTFSSAKDAADNTDI